MAKASASKRAEDGPDDPTLGAKIRHLIGVFGYRLGHQHTLDRNIAQYIGVDPSTWARMKSGALKADAEKLGLLTEYFRLDAKYRLTFEIFLCPTLGAFKALLKQHEVGAYGAAGIDHIRSRLARARNLRTNGITFEKSAPVTRAGGLGNPPAPRSKHPTFRPGDAVTVRISHPEAGHLLVLNDGPDGEIVCLMPSELAPRTTVTGRATRLPTEDSPVPAFPINEPAGVYRLYALWTRNPVALDFVREAMTSEGAFVVVPAAGFRQLGALIEGFDKAAKNGLSPTTYELRIADYEVKG